MKVLRMPRNHSVKNGRVLVATAWSSREALNGMALKGALNVPRCSISE